VAISLPLIPAAAQDGPTWPMYRSDPQHTGACGSGVPASLDSTLAVSLGTAALTSPVAAGGRIFVCSPDGTLFAVWADTGGVAWQRSLGGNSTAEPAVDGGTVYALTEGGRLLAYDTGRGALLWSAPLPEGLGYMLPLTFSNGSILVSTTSGNVLRVSARDPGRVLWQSPAGARMKGPVTVGDGLVYCIIDGGRAVALDLESGNQTWSSSPGTGSGNDLTSAYIQGRLYIGTRGRDVFCLDTSNGSVVWTESLKSTISGSPALGGGLIFLGTQNGLVYALDLADGKSAWPKPYDIGANVTMSPALAGGMVILGNDKGNVYVLSAATGQQKAGLSLGRARLSPPVVSEGRILLTSMDGALFIVGPVLRAPVAVLDITPERVSAGDEVVFSARNSTAADGLSVASCFLDFGDGKNSGWSIGPAFGHAYPQKGRYTVSLKVRDANGTESHEVWAEVEVFNDRPSVRLELPGNATANSPAILGASASDPDGQIVLYEWDFDGDGSFDWNGSALLPGFNHTYLVNGTYHPAVRVQDDNGTYGTASGTLVVLPGQVVPPVVRPAPDAAPLSLPVAVASVSLVSLAAIGAGLSLTDFGKYRFFTLFIVPLYVRLKHDEVLDNYTRGKIHGYIIANPGDNYNSIRDALELSNGIVAHHLHTLEREGLIQSMRDGMYRRFFPANAKLPPEDEGHFNIQKRIVAIIRDSPGISQKEIAQKAGVSSPTVNYHVSVLSTARMIRVERFGRRTRCFVVEDQPHN
jgi:outer membrane protein assembly factor BamB/DNA-binding MarR family transcriptional regulator